MLFSIAESPQRHEADEQSIFVGVFPSIVRVDSINGLGGSVGSTLKVFWRLVLSRRSHCNIVEFQAISRPPLESDLATPGRWSDSNRLQVFLHHRSARLEYRDPTRICLKSASWLIRSSSTASRTTLVIYCTHRIQSTVFSTAAVMPIQLQARIISLNDNYLFKECSLTKGVQCIKAFNTFFYSFLLFVLFPLLGLLVGCLRYE